MLQRTPESQQRLVEILIVEDDTAILDTLSYNLQRQGFEVHKATTEAEEL